MSRRIIRNTVNIDLSDSTPVKATTLQSDSELREEIKHLLGYCEPINHNCSYESSRNETQELDGIMQLIKARDIAREKEIRLDELKYIPKATARYSDGKLLGSVGGRQKELETS